LDQEGRAIEEQRAGRQQRAIARLFCERENPG
jgi:hypothetical protein